MTDHNCVRNPDNGACYVCMVPMRLRYIASSPLDAIIDATMHPTVEPTTKHVYCSCGASITGNEVQCIDCWIQSQTRQTIGQVKASNCLSDIIAATNKRGKK